LQIPAENESNLYKGLYLYENSIITEHTIKHPSIFKRRTEPAEVRGAGGEFGDQEFESLYILK